MDGPGKAPWHLWLVGVLALLWNGYGAIDYSMTQLRNSSWMTSQGFSQSQADAMLAYAETYPAWADAAWALGTFGGVAGAVLLLVRRRFAFGAFAVSLIGAVGTLVATTSRELPEDLAEVAGGPVIYFIVVIAVLLLFYAWAMRRRGVLR